MRLFLPMLIGLMPISIIVAGQRVPSAMVKVPNAGNAATVVPYKPSSYTTGTTVNYVRTWEPKKQYELETDVVSDMRTVEEVNETTQYVDGLGRPIQTVSWQSSPGKKDMVSPL